MVQEDPDVEILDKDIYLATISEGGSLNIEMRVKIGRGYVPAEKNFDEDLPIGFIPVDSAHSPIRKVNHTVEAARLGQMTDYDKLTLDVWTNGAIPPADAVGLAAKLIKDHMAIFINFEELPEAEGVAPNRWPTDVMRIWTGRSKSWSSRFALTTASRMRTSPPFVNWCRRPSRTC